MYIIIKLYNVNITWNLISTNLVQFNKQHSGSNKETNKGVNCSTDQHQWESSATLIVSVLLENTLWLDVCTYLLDLQIVKDK